MHRTAARATGTFKPFRAPASAATWVLVCALLWAPLASLAQGASTRTVAPQAATHGVAPNLAPQIAARSWLLLDMTTGQLLAARDPDQRVEPASLTKLMTAYLVFNALKDKRVTASMRPPVSDAAFKAIGSRMFLEPRNPATIEELLNGLIVQSGNDAAIVLAEALAGSEAAFAQQMNAEAKRLGMTQTQFQNASGLPDPQHYSTARDMATLAQRIITDHPDFYALYSRREYTYNSIRQPNRNRLLAIDPSVDGLKTGHTEAAGFCLVASAKRPAGNGLDRRLLTVVMGAASEPARIIETQKLLNYGFVGFEIVRLYQRDQAAGTYEVWKGRAPALRGGFTDDVFVSVVRGQASRVRGEIERVEPLIAPVTKGQPIGTLRVRFDDRLLAEQPLVALERIDEAGWWGRMLDSVRLWLK